METVNLKNDESRMHEYGCTLHDAIAIEAYLQARYQQAVDKVDFWEEQGMAHDAVFAAQKEKIEARVLKNQARRVVVLLEALDREHADKMLNQARDEFGGVA